jgi:hypothetical protein
MVCKPKLQYIPLSTEVERKKKKLKIITKEMVRIQRLSLHESVSSLSGEEKEKRSTSQQSVKTDKEAENTDKKR